MAVDVGTAIGYLDLDTSGFQRGFKSAMQDLKTFTDDTKSTETRIAALGNSMTSAGSTLTKGLTLPLVAVGTAAVVTAAQFESAMSEVKAISGATGIEFDGLVVKAKEMGATTKFSASEAAEAMKYMGMAGWDAGQMIDGLEGIMNLAAASGENLGTVSDIVTDALTAFGLQASDAGQFADILAAAATNANTNVGMLGESFKYVAPVAGALGYSVEDVSVALGLMANSGIKASQAGTSLRQIILGLQGGVELSVGGIKNWHIEVENADGTMRDFNDVVVDLREAFGNMTEAERAANAEMIAGKIGMSGLLAIVNAGEADFNKLTYSINNADGTAKNMAQTMQDNLAGQFIIMKSSIEGIAIAFGDAMLPAVKKVAEGLQNLLNWLSSLDDSQRKTIVTIAAVVAAIGPALLIGGKIVSLISSTIAAYKTVATVIQAATAKLSLYTIQQGLSAAKAAIENAALAAKNLAVGLLSGQITLATAAQWLWNAAMSANPVGLVVIAVAALVAGIIALVSWLNRESEEQKALKKQTEATIESHNALKTALEDSARAHDEKINSINADFEASKRLTDKIFELSQAENMSASDKRVLAAYVDDLNESMGELILQFDEETGQLLDSTGAVVSNTDAVKDLIDARKSQAENDALIERERELVKELILVEEELRKNAGALKDLEVAYEDGVITQKQYNQQTEALREAGEELQAEFEDRSESIRVNTEMIEENAQRQMELAPEIANAWVAANGEIMASEDEMLEKNKQILESIESYVDSVTDMYNKINEEAKGSVEEYLATLDHNYEASQRFTENLDTLMEKGLDAALVQNFRDMGLGAAGEVAIWADATDEQIQELNEKMARNTEEGTTAVVDMFENSGIPDAVVGVYSQALEESQAKINEFFDLGGSIIDGIAEGVESSKENATQAISDTSDVMQDAFQSSNGIHSPSTVYAEFGGHLMTGLAQGVEQNASVVVAAVTKITDDIAGQFSKLPADTKKHLDDTAKNVSSWATDMQAKTSPSIAKLVSDTTTEFGKLPGEVKKHLDTVVQNVTAWSTDMQQKAQTAATNFNNAVMNELKKLPGEVKQQLDIILQNVTVWSSEMQQKGQLAATNFNTAILTELSKLPGEFKKQLDIITQSVDSWSAEMKSKATSVGQSFVNNIVTEIKKLPDEFKQVFQQILTYLNGLDPQFATSGRNMMTSLFNEIKSIGNDIASWVDDWAKQISRIIDKMLDDLKDAKAAARDAADGKSHAHGLDYVPYNGYQATLHEGERVLTAEENRAYNGGGTGNGNVYNFYSPEPLTPVECRKQMIQAERESALGFV